jgi:hypothetical protein
MSFDTYTYIFPFFFPIKQLTDERDAANIVLCDNENCNSEVHLSCLHLTSVPTYTWFCRLSKYIPHIYTHIWLIKKHEKYIKNNSTKQTKNSKYVMCVSAKCHEKSLWTYELNNQHLNAMKPSTEKDKRNSTKALSTKPKLSIISISIQDMSIPLLAFLLYLSFNIS